MVWGDWELARLENKNNQPEFRMQKSFGKHASLNVIAANEDAENFESSDNKRMSVGFEYHLKSEDSLKLKVTKDEEFVGVERKMKF